MSASGIVAYAVYDRPEVNVEPDCPSGPLVLHDHGVEGGLCSPDEAHPRSQR